MILWLVMTVMVAVVASALTIPLVLRRDARGRVGTVAVLKAQLAEMEAQVASGAMRREEADALATEIKRRLLNEAAEEPPPRTPLPGTALRWLALGLAALLAAAATTLYAMLGNPTVPGVASATPNSGAPATANPHATADIGTLVGQLEAKMRQHPGDPEGWRMLGWSYMQTGRPADAATAYARAAALDPKNADYFSAEGEALTQAAGGQVTPAALNAFRRALAADAGDPRARYFLAALKDEQGDHAGAVADWIALLKSAPVGAAWAPQVRGLVERTARQYNIAISGKLPASTGTAQILPPEGNANAMPGPTPGEVAAASQMPEGDRQAMIRGMVDRLAAELKENPRNEEGWVRLMRARMVLGDVDAAAIAYRDACKVFAGDAADIAALQRAARDLRVPGA